MKLIDFVSRASGLLKICVRMNTGDGLKPHEIGIFAPCEVPETLMERNVYWFIGEDDKIMIVISAE